MALALGLSLSSEIGYQRRAYSPDTWTVEIRPIVDVELGRWSLAFDSTFARAIEGLASRGAGSSRPRPKSATR